MFFKNNDAKYIYGIAIILMILHHLMGFPERFNNELIAVLPFEYQIGVFGKICVGIYAFITGYGLAVNVKSTVNENVILGLSRLIGFYKKFWLVYIVFVPIGILINEINAPLHEYISNFFGMRSSFNGEWWYIKQYVLILVSFPLLWEFLIWWGKYRNGINTVFVLIFVIILRYISPYLALSFIGMVFQKYLLFEKINSVKFNNKRPILFSAILIALVVFVRCLNPSVKIDVFLVPVLIFALVNIKNSIKYNCKILELMGELSVWIWLTHSFYLYHYFQEMILLFRYSVPMFCVTTFLSIATALTLKMIYKKMLDDKK